MKKRNKYFLKEKEYLRLKKELEKNSYAQRQLGWVELDKPKHIGWTAKIQPRQDILNRQDDWVFIGICDLYSTTSFAKKIDYFEWNKKRNNPKDRFIVYSKPHIRSISEWEYDRLVPQAKKWFKIDEYSGHSSWRGNSYYCTVPNFYWEIFYEKSYQTKVKISDCILEQEEAEIQYQIDKKFHIRDKSCKGCPKSFRKKLNRSQRAKSKQTLYNIVINGKDEEFVDNYRGARWLWW